MTEEDWSGIRWFTVDEFRCNCGCGISNPHLEMIQRLDRARDRAEVPFRISSGSRCADHNASLRVSLDSSPTSVDSSAHLASDEQVSFAADIVVSGARNRYKIHAALAEVGFTRFGLGDRFIHTDIDPTKAPEVTWLY
jgi:hypothetical protein